MHGCRSFFELDEDDVLSSGFHADTWLDNRGWGRGLALINEFNLGYYWPTVGPQETQYVPGPVLKNGTNILTIIEFEHTPEDATGMSFLILPVAMRLEVHMCFRIPPDTSRRTASGP